MHVRISLITGASDIDRGVDFLRDQVVPHLQQQHGFRGLSASADHSTGSVAVLSAWDSEADLDASESAADKARTDAMKIMGGEVRIERYEQGLMETGSTPPGPGARLHIRHIRIEPSGIDENLGFFRENVVPGMKAMRGFVSVRALVNRRTGEGRVGSIWADDDCLQAYMAQTEDRRAVAREHGVEFGEEQRMEVLFAAM